MYCTKCKRHTLICRAKGHDGFALASKSSVPVHTRCSEDLVVRVVLLVSLRWCTALQRVEGSSDTNFGSNNNRAAQIPKSVHIVAAVTGSLEYWP